MGVIANTVTGVTVPIASLNGARAPVTLFSNLKSCLTSWGTVLGLRSAKLFARVRLDEEDAARTGKVMSLARYRAALPRGQ